MTVKTYTVRVKCEGSFDLDVDAVSKEEAIDMVREADLANQILNNLDCKFDAKEKTECQNMN